jgi:glycerate 2-kinase
VVLGAGKAAAAMAQAVERHWPGPLSGLVVTPYGHGLPLERVELAEAAHPVPDAAGLAAARRMLELARGLGVDDLALCLFSGGGSALLPLPAPGLGLEDEQQVTRRLLGSGAAIGEINCVRKHLSGIKGGRLAAACTPARVHTLLISDVPGDDPASVASGPTVPDPTTYAEALAILDRFSIGHPAARAHLLAGHQGRGPQETPKPGDPRFPDGETIVVARAQDALAAAATGARKDGVTPLVLSDSLEGEARELGGFHAELALQTLQHGQPVEPPCVLLSGGEATVTVRGGGRGGRNSEFLLALALALERRAGAKTAPVWALACDTDGLDGTEASAGAILAPGAPTRARSLGLDPQALLDANDSHTFFAALDDLVVTGPTRTNVNDLRAVLVTGIGADRYRP